MALFEVTEYDKKVYEEQLKDFLPKKIFDVHVHVWLNALVDERDEKDAPKRTVSWPGLVAPENSLEDLQESFKLFFPDKECEALMFTSRRASKANNDYVAEASRKSGWPALYYSHPEESADQIEERIREGHFLGLKGYLNLSPAYIPEKEVRIFDFFPHHQLERLNKMGGMMMLHIPRDGRLQDPVNLAQMIEIYKTYPNIRMIIAHIGRAYTEPDIGNAFEILREEAPNMVFDFTANCYDKAIEECIKFTGPKRTMFGSDLPILRMRTHRITEGGNYVNLVPKGLYGDVSGDRHMREVVGADAEKITFFMYEELLSFKRVAEKLGLTRQDVEDIMYNNAKNMVLDAEKAIYG